MDLADDEEMMRMMHDARFESVFLGIETPDEASLETARKVQNTRNPLDAAVDRITANGIRVMAGFIIGFDGEKNGAGHRIVDFVTRTGIPAAMMGMLQALPKTRARLEREGRLIQGEDAAKGVNQTNLLNFKPTRPIRDIANEYVDAFCALYEPNAYMDRVYSYYKMGAPTLESRGQTAQPGGPQGAEHRGVAARHQAQHPHPFLACSAHNLPCLNSSYRCWPTTSTSSNTARSFRRKSASSWNHCLQKNPQQPKNCSRPDPQSCT